MPEPRVPFQDVVEALLGSKDLPRGYAQYFSDIEPGSLGILMDAWPRIRADRKHALLDQLELAADQDTLVSFQDLARALLNDPDAGVRASAIRLLLDSNDPKLVPAYLNIMQEDPSELARAEAAGALGEYVMLGELEEIPTSAHRQAEDALLKVANSEDSARVRRRAMESLGFSSRPEVVTLIESAFNRQDPEWKASALFAMGRSSDERWQDHVLQMLLSENQHVRLAAVEAAGELALVPARSILIGLLDEEDDDDIAGAAIWSLSQIGGEDARALIESLLDQAEDDELVDFLEEALENLAFTEDLDRFDLMSFDPEELDEDSEN
jgi:HEAT repeat protein